MDTTAPTDPRGSDIINELLSRVTHGFDSHPRGSDIIKELLSRVTHGFDCPNCP